ncbi:fibrinogen C domain-containing protein 1-like [Anopheles albimanus]|uniref:fibrinogen C domain-containing protein 1-like n=1 Tax=Anopheles albimanus TaxID=7167 RepID=UPI00163F288D|nr:fibrinogen C domain-containing protein 1-like [Anopheles albimanus]
MLQSVVSKLILRVGLIVCCVVVYIGASDRGQSTYGTLGYGLELVLTKFDFITNKLQKIEDRLQKTENKLQNVENQIHQHRSTQEQIVALLHERCFSHEQEAKRSQKDVFATIEKLENSASLNVSELQNQEKIVAALHKLDQDVNDVHNISQQIRNALPQLHHFTEILQKQCCVSATVKYKSVVTPTEISAPQPPPTTPTATTTINGTAMKSRQIPFSSCKNVNLKVSGTYLVRVKNNSEPFEVYCEQTAFGGGWIVFQYRYDGSLDFYRGWNEFRDGFGDLNKEFWLGFEKVHQLTSERKHELIIQLKDFNGNSAYAWYNMFEIGSESEQYILKDVRKYNGTAGDVMPYYRGRKFSTKDRDNDESSRHCAQLYEGAWWHKNCTGLNLNGRYMNGVDEKSIHWYSFKRRQGLSYTRMMIREL